MGEVVEFPRKNKQIVKDFYQKKIKKYPTIDNPDDVELNEKKLSQEQVIKDIATRVSRFVNSAFWSHAINLQEEMSKDGNMVNDGALIHEAVKSLVSRFYHLDHPLHGIADNFFDNGQLREGPK